MFPASRNRASSRRSRWSRPENQYKQSGDTPEFHPMDLKGLAPAGRLDIDSTGLLVLTQDGRVAGS
jgi:23S rRNA pseudouridine2604 synthase